MTKTNLYGLLKLLHISCVVVSIALFSVRFTLLRRFPDRPLAIPLKMLPHINDTVLLTAAIGMLTMLSLNPFTSPWLLTKIGALLLYIGLGAVCLKSTPGSKQQLVYFLLALSVFAFIVSVAINKQYSPL